jgi:hypothetical protein
MTPSTPVVVGGALRLPICVNVEAGFGFSKYLDGSNLNFSRQLRAQKK